MGRKKRHILPLLSIVASLLFTSCNDPIDWSENYLRDNTEPYGAQSIYELLPQVMQGKEVKVIARSIKPLLPEIFKDTIKSMPFNALKVLDTLEVKKENFLFVKRAFQMSPGDANALQVLIRNGCHVIVASNEFGTTFSENYELKLKTVEGFDFGSPDTALINMEFKSVFYRSKKGPIEFQVREKMVRNHFTEFAYYFNPILTDSADNVLALHAKIGEGSLIICSTPKIFSNFQLIHSNYRLPNNFFNLIPVQETYWGNNYVSRDPRTKFKQSEKSRWDFIFSNPAITWAFWLMIAGGLLYTLNYMRRKQLPFIYKPEVKNMTLSYISSVAQLYMKGGSHQEILKKKSDLFFWNLSRKYGFSKTEPQENLALFLSKRIADLSLEEIKESISIAHQAQEGLQIKGPSVNLAFKKIDRLKNRL